MYVSVRPPHNLFVDRIQSLQLAHATEFFILKNMLGQVGRELGSTGFSIVFGVLLRGFGSTRIIFVNSIFIVKN